MSDKPALPELESGLLDDATLHALFRDLGACTEIIEIITKGAPSMRASTSNPTLSQAQALLRSGAVRGVQIRYRYQDAEWWDTLIQAPGGVRLVRIQPQLP